MDLRAEGDLLVVREGARIPKVCVKCGATKDVSRREIPFTVGQTGFGAGMAGGAIGAVVASTLRNVLRDEPALQALVLTVLLGGGILGAWAIGARAEKIHLEVPLCAEHGAQLETAQRTRTAFLVSLGIAGVMLVIGVGTEAIVLIGLGLVVVFGMLAVAFATGSRKAWVTASWAKDEHVALVVGAETAKKMVERAERRAARKQREAAAP